MEPGTPCLAGHGVDLAGRHLDGDRESKTPSWSPIAEVQPHGFRLPHRQDDAAARRRLSRKFARVVFDVSKRK
jgi:hypothetical protein